MLINQCLLKHHYSIITSYVIFPSCENFLYFPGVLHPTYKIALSLVSCPVNLFGSLERSSDSLQPFLTALVNFP